MKIGDKVRFLSEVGGGIVKGFRGKDIVLVEENPKHIRISEYNYPLPDERIAKFPLPVRDQSKLLIYRHGA